MHILVCQSCASPFNLVIEQSWPLEYYTGTILATWSAQINVSGLTFMTSLVTPTPNKKTMLSFSACSHTGYKEYSRTMVDLPFPRNNALKLPFTFGSSGSTSCHYHGLWTRPPVEGRSSCQAAHLFTSGRVPNQAGMCWRLPF